MRPAACYLSAVSLPCDRASEQKTYGRDALAVVHEARESYRNQCQSFVVDTIGT